jgi:hypothetical protein
MTTAANPRHARRIFVKMGHASVFSSFGPRALAPRRRTRVRDRRSIEQHGKRCLNGRDRSRWFGHREHGTGRSRRRWRGLGRSGRIGRREHDGIGGRRDRRRGRWGRVLVLTIGRRGHSFRRARQPGNRRRSLPLAEIIGDSLAPGKTLTLSSASGIHRVVVLFDPIGTGGLFEDSAGIDDVQFEPVVAVCP